MVGNNVNIQYEINAITGLSLQACEIVSSNGTKKIKQIKVEKPYILR